MRKKFSKAFLLPFNISTQSLLSADVSFNDTSRRPRYLTHLSRPVANLIKQFTLINYDSRVVV